MERYRVKKMGSIITGNYSLINDSTLYSIAGSSLIINFNFPHSCFTHPAFNEVKNILECNLQIEN